MQAKEIGMVLSGGGVRGVAHAGILQALQENDITPTRLSGSSSGAMVSALYAAGYYPEEILEFFQMNAAHIFRWKYFYHDKPGFLDAEQYAELFEPWLKEHTFESLSKKLHICVTDVLNGKIRFFSSGELVRPILASAAIPGVFTPVEIGEDWYIDGGTMNNFPVEPLMGQCDFLLGSYVSLKKIWNKSELTNTFKLVNRANELTFLGGSVSKFHSCDFVLAPPELWQYGIFETKKVEQIYEVGYQYALGEMKTLQKAFEEINHKKEVH